MRSNSLDIRPISGALGAEILGVDLKRGMSDELAAAVRAAWLEHLVLFFRDQDLSPSEFQAFAERFGTAIEYPFVRGLPDHPLIVPVVKLEHERVNFGGIWHSDTTYLENPPMASMLIAREVPSHGGDTEFANQYLAHEALSEGLRRALAGMKWISCSDKADVSRTREDRIKDSGVELAKMAYQAEHPVVRTHPETGRKSLFVNVAHALRFADMTDEESAPLLAFLHRHQTRPEFTCRFRWRAGSIAMWDNRCALHNPINDYHGQRRVMHRMTLAGDRPR
ncbi:MAG: TauD/TfdA dioxygenase family protein [Alphaproteobacteria bacterium]